MTYGHLSQDERCLIARQRARGISCRQIALMLGRATSTVSRELKRNSCTYDGHYRVEKAHGRAVARRSRSRRNSQYSQQEWAEVQAALRQQWSPKQVIGRRCLAGKRYMSYETVYRWIRAQTAGEGVACGGTCGT